MTYADMFSKVKGMMMEADVSTVNEHLAYQFNVTGEGNLLCRGKRRKAVCGTIRVL